MYKATPNKQFKEITRGTKTLIKNAIIETKSSNKYELLDHICNELCERFVGDTLDYQLSRMKLETTNEVLSAIDTYMYKYAKDSDFVDEADEE